MHVNKKPLSPCASNDGAERGEKADTTNIDEMLVAGIGRGLTKADTETMTMGMWTDYIIEWNNMHQKADNEYKKTHDEKGNKVTTRKAAQNDFDNF